MKLLHTLIIATIVSTMPLAGRCEEKPPTSPPPKQETTKERTLPFNGKLSAIDKDAQTITVGDRRFHLTPTTKLVKAGKPATLDDAVVGEPIGGSYRQMAEGRNEAQSVRFGPKPAKEDNKTAE